MKSSRAFTLIELLVVIAILGILMALLFPAVQGVLDSAKKVQAKNDVVQIATAVTVYETEYGRLPATNNTPINVEGDVLRALMGSNANSLNPRQIVFLEVQNSKKGKSGISNNSVFVGPWGETYQIVFDDDYDNRIDSAGTSPGPVGTNIMKKVAVWNEPPGKSPTEKKRRSVASWE
jgi:prepilin-type N-terminal cleavage/methylation domain-containing protein